MSTFNAIRSQAVSLENQTSSLLSRYSSFAMSPSSSPTAEELQLEKQVESLLHKRDDLLGSLTRTSESDTSISTVKLQQLSRHREVLGENWKQFGQIKSSILQERNKINLLLNVKTDIEDHQRRFKQDEMDYAHEEQQRANALNGIADDLLNRAFETRENLLGQRGTLRDAGIRMTNVLSSVPGINVLIQKINTRRRRDALILAGLISICIVLLFFSF